MLRAILGVILGFVVMAVLVFTGLTAIYLVMGAEWSFKPESYDVSMQWLIVWFVVSLVAAGVGGLVCAGVSRSSQAPLALAAVVFIVGLLSALPNLAVKNDAPKKRTSEVGNLEAMAQAQQPTWVAFATPLIGALGVVGGGKLRRSPRVS